MRIAHVTDCYLPRLGGIETQVGDLAGRQRRDGHDVHVVTATPRARHDRTRYEILDGVPVHRVALDLPFELPVHHRAGARVGELLARHRYDVVHLHVGVVSPFAMAALPAVVRAGVPAVVTVHSVWGRAGVGFRALGRLGPWPRWPVAWTAVSEVAAAPVRRAVAGPVAVLPNGIDPDRWLRPPLPRDADTLLLVAVMRLTVRKRPLALVDVLERIRQRVPAAVRLRAEVFGDGPQLAAVRRRLHRRGMAGWVAAPGRVSREELAERYRAADLFLAPARLESFGIAALEARTAGLPVVAMAGSGVGEFVTPGIEGLLCADDAEMVEAVVRLARDRGLRERIAAHSRAVPPVQAWPQVLRTTGDCYRRARALADAVRDGRATRPD